MSMKDRLSKKTEGLVVPAKAEGVQGAQSAGPLRTSPGQMLMVNSLMKENNEKLAALEERLKQYEGVLPVKLIPAEAIKPSKWANRSAIGFESVEFEALKAEIGSAGGNVQPIKVRPKPGSESEYEVVFGHRRHRACLELGLPVLALIEETSDADLFKEMDRENRARQDLSPWEQGMMYRRALEEKLFPSQERLARELGVDAGNVSKALRLAMLDERLVKAFRSPLELQYRWAKPLSEAFVRDPDGVLACIEDLSGSDTHSLAAKEIFERLTQVKKPDVEIFPIEVNGKALALIETRSGEVVLKFKKGVVDFERLGELEEFVVKWLNGESR